jgi:hypothetical protein
MTTNDQMPRVSPDWLAQREAADGAARATDLVAAVRRVVAGAPRLVVHDLGSGTASMARWLAPQLPGPQHWVLHDRDADLLEWAAADMPVVASDGTPVKVETRHGDVTALTVDDLSDAALVTASALLDLLTADEVDRIAAACGATPALFTLSVTGRVALDPPDPLDTRVAAAFHAHQRRTVAGRRLLGPDAPEALVGAYAGRGVATTVSPSPWRLPGGSGELLAQWFADWVGAAVEQEAALAAPVAWYAGRRRAEMAAGRLRAIVGHVDVLARP